ncbi:MAG: SMP-30/gluconolactonase/LRE family protein [Bacteroidota bacterium]
MKKLLCIILALCTVSIAQEDPFELFSRSRQSLAQGDTAAYLKYAKEARDLAPFDLWFSANLARAYAMNKQKIRCIEILDDLSVLGFDFGILNDEGFKYIWTHSLLKEITKRAQRNIPRENSITAFTIPESSLVVNGITYDPRRSIFYLGNLFHRKIVGVRSDGSTFDAGPQETDSLWSPFSMTIDAARNRVWVTNTSLPSEKSGAAALYEYDLETMTAAKEYSPGDSLEHFFNHIVVPRYSSVFITDTKNGAVYTINEPTGTIEPWFVSDDMIQPKGIALSDDQKYLFVAHWRGISRISLEDKRSVLLTAKVKTTLTGIDGLYFYDGNLIAVQNNAGPQARIMRFELSKKMDAVTKATVLESGHHLHDNPTAGVIVGDDFYYVANTRTKSIAKDGTILPEKQLQPTYILKPPLKK